MIKVYSKVISVGNESIPHQIEELTQKVDAMRSGLVRLEETPTTLSIQSLSIDVPGQNSQGRAPCPNKCFFCVSQLHDNPYPNLIGARQTNGKLKDLFIKDYVNRMAFARDNNVNNLIFTGTGEPLLNLKFIQLVSSWNSRLEKPFRFMEIQTSGVTMDDEKLEFLRQEIGISTISLSLSSIWNSKENAAYNRTANGKEVDIDFLCSQIKDNYFNLRLSLNLTDVYNDKSPESIFGRAHQLGANQITFRQLYSVEKSQTQEENRINADILRYQASPRVIQDINRYAEENGRPLERLTFGPMRFSIEGISVVVDQDSMSSKINRTIKYLILRPNARLYTKWDEPGSLLF